MSEMCVHGICGHQKHIQGAKGFYQPVEPIAPVLKVSQPQHKIPGLITGDDALKVKANYDRNNFIVSQSMPQDVIIKRCTRH